jgi:hypothetical protein
MLFFLILLDPARLEKVAAGTRQDENEEQLRAVEKRGVRSQIHLLVIWTRVRNAETAAVIFTVSAIGICGCQNWLVLRRDS